MVRKNVMTILLLLIKKKHRRDEFFFCAVKLQTFCHQVTCTLYGSIQSHDKNIHIGKTSMEGIIWCSSGETIEWTLPLLKVAMDPLKFGVIGGRKNLCEMPVNKKRRDRFQLRWLMVLYPFCFYFVIYVPQLNIPCSL